MERLKMKKAAIFIILLFAITSANAQKLTFAELTSTFTQPSIEKLEAFLENKGFDYFRRDVTSGGNDTSRTYRPIDRSKYAFFDFKTYKSDKTKRVYNYRVKYVVFNIDDFKSFGELLLTEKYKKVEGKALSFENDKYLVDLEVVKPSALARAYAITITNKQLGAALAEIEFDKLLRKATN